MNPVRSQDYEGRTKEAVEYFLAAQNITKFKISQADDEVSFELVIIGPLEAHVPTPLFYVRFNIPSEDFIALRTVLNKVGFGLQGALLPFRDERDESVLRYQANLTVVDLHNYMSPDSPRIKEVMQN